MHFFSYFHKVSNSSRSRSVSPVSEESSDDTYEPVQRGRGRGRRGRTTRGVGRTNRGGRRGRGRVQGPAPPTRADRAQALREERDIQLRVNSVVILN